MIERRVRQTDTVEARLPVEALRQRDPRRVDHLPAPLPVVDGERAVVLTTDHVNRPRDVQLQVVDRPFLAIGTDTMLLDETQEMRLLPLDADRHRRLPVDKGVNSVEHPVAEVTLRLQVHERAHLTGHPPTAVPPVEHLLHVRPVALPLHLRRLQRVERLEEISDQTAHGQQPFSAVVGIDMLVGHEVDITVLVVAPRLRERKHLLLHLRRPRQPRHQLTAVTLLTVLRHDRRHQSRRFTMPLPSGRHLQRLVVRPPPHGRQPRLGHRLNGRHLRHQRPHQLHQIGGTRLRLFRHLPLRQSDDRPSMTVQHPVAVVVATADGMYHPARLRRIRLVYLDVDPHAAVIRHQGQVHLHRRLLCRDVQTHIREHPDRLRQPSP